MRLSLLASRIARRRRAGLTLMELVVVMVILIALAGIILPLFPSMLTRAHTSSTATNIAEASKAVQLYYNMYSGYPNNLDNLVPGGAGIIGRVLRGSGHYCIRRNTRLGRRPGSAYFHSGRREHHRSEQCRD